MGSQIGYHLAVKQKNLQFTIGRYPDISPNHARDQASKLLAQLADGVDIKDERNKIRAEATKDDLYNKWHKTAKHRKRSIKDDERTYELPIQHCFGKNGLVQYQQARFVHGTTNSQENLVSGKKMAKKRCHQNHRQTAA